MIFHVEISALTVSFLRCFVTVVWSGNASGPKDLCHSPNGRVLQKWKKKTKVTGSSRWNWKMVIKLGLMSK